MKHKNGILFGWKQKWIYSKKGECKMTLRERVELEDEVELDDLDVCCEEKKVTEEKKKEICGVIVYDEFSISNPENFKFRIRDNSNEYNFKVIGATARNPVAPVEGKRYKVSFLGSGEFRAAVDIKAIDAESIEELAIERDFLRKCIERGAGRVIPAKDIEGKFVCGEDDGGIFRFTVLCEEDIFCCVYEKGMNYGIEFPMCKQGQRIKVRIYSVCGTNYVRTSATDQIAKEVVVRNIHKLKIEEAYLHDEQKEEYIALLEEKSLYPIVEKENIGQLAKSERALVKKYELLSCIYPPSVQKAINHLMNRGGIKSSHRAEALELLVNTDWNKELQINDDTEYLKRELDRRFFGQKHYKQEIIKMISAFRHRKKRKGGAMLLVGVPGIGKTSMFKYAAEVAGIPFEKISLNSVSNGEYLVGTPLLYSNAMAGRIMTAVRRIGNRAIILLDEVDKMEKNGDNDPKTALYELLDGNEKFRDNFIDEEIDLSDIQFVLTANDTSSIPAPILDRVTVVRIDDYTDEEKINIAKNYVLPEELSKYDLGGKTIEWEDEALENLATRYTMSSGVRDIERNIESVVRTAVWKMREGKLDCIKVKNAELPDFLGIIPCKREKIEHSYSALRRKFSCFKPEYDPQVREATESLLTEYETAKDESVREYIRKSLFCLVNILPSQKKGYDLQQIKKKLDESHYGMEDLKNEIITVLASEEKRNCSAPRCILLDGPSGVGKSSICESIAEASGRKLVRISLNGVSNATFIKGSERQYNNSACGVIVSSLANAGNDGVLILLDEVDKMTVTQNGDPFAALIDLLDDSGLFMDSFLNVPINVSNVLMIATSNDASKIPAALFNRMSAINVPGYSTKEKIHIARSYILPKKLAEYGLESDDSEIGEIMDNVVYEYCRGFGLRDIARVTDKLVRESIRKRSFEGERLCTDEASITRLLGAIPHERGNVAPQEKYRAGIARALAVSGNEGTTFAVQVTENRFSEADEITGLPRASTLDSIKIAKLLVSKMLGRHLPTLHFHFGEGGIEKDGPSAGITIFSALYSCMLGIEVPRDIGMTGEIDIFGDVWAIGGAELKIRAAEGAGCRRVYIPKQNYESLLAEGKLSCFECEIIPVSNVSELCADLFEGRDVKKK